MKASLSAVTARTHGASKAMEMKERSRISQHSAAVGEAWTQFHPVVQHPVLLVPGIGGSVLHARASPLTPIPSLFDAITPVNGTDTPLDDGVAAAAQALDVEDFIVWIRSLQAEDTFKRYMCGPYDAATHTVGSWANGNGKAAGNSPAATSGRKWKVYSPPHRSGLYAVDTLAPNWFVKVRGAKCMVSMHRKLL